MGNYHLNQTHQHFSFTCPNFVPLNYDISFTYFGVSGRGRENFFSTDSRQCGKYQQPIQVTVTIVKPDTFFC